MVKRNRMNIRTDTDGYIKSYFKDEINLLLTPRDNMVRSSESPYVRHERAERFLEHYNRPNEQQDRIVFFTGLTGSGKTTILKNYFHFGIREEIRSKINEETRTVLIPIDFNFTQVDAEKAIMGSLRAAADKICEQYGISYPDTEDEAFYEYVVERREGLIYGDPDFHKHTHAQRLEAIKERDSFSGEKILESCRFQYIMDQSEKLDHVLIIIDDVEAFSDQEKPLEPIIHAFKLAECFNHRGAKTTWMYSMIISCRHHIWRLMKERHMDDIPSRPLLQSFITNDQGFDLYDPVKIEPIVEKRQGVFGAKQRDLNKWDTAVKVVKDILFQADNDVGELIHQLELKNTRKSFELLRDLVLNKNLQRVSAIDTAPGAFRIDSVEQFDITRVNLIRQFGLGSWQYYANEHSEIPNLLYNLPATERDIEVYPLLTLKYFLRLCNYEEPEWQIYYQISHFLRRTHYIFGYTDEVNDETFGRAARYLIKNRMLLRSKDQDQKETAELQYEARLREIEMVYVSGAAICLWNELRESSALFQLFIDDVWLPRNSDYFGDDGNDIEHCANYLIQLWKKEQRIYHAADNLMHAQDYCDLFGRKPVCLQLLIGLERSLNKICDSMDEKSADRKRSAAKTLQRIVKLKTEMRDWS